MAKKIRSYDKFQALKRNPGYQADYQEFVNWCRERGIDHRDYQDYPEAAQKAEEICQKYGIWFLFHPKAKLPGYWGGNYFTEGDEIVEVIYPNKYRDLSKEEISRGERSKFLPIPIFDDGDKLILKIDLTKGKDEIKEVVNSKIDYYHYFGKEGNSRLSKDKYVNKWAVFDIYNETKSFKETCRKLLLKAKSQVKFLKLLRGDAEIHQIDESTVRKAYYRAFELVYGEKYNPEKHSPRRLPPELTIKCNICSERETCTTLCSEVMNYVSQDERYLREKLMNKDSYDIVEPDVFDIIDKDDE